MLYERKKRLKFKRGARIQLKFKTDKVKLMGWLWGGGIQWLGFFRTKIWWRS